MAMLNNQRVYIYMTSHAQNGITIKASLPLNCVEECWLGKPNSRLLVTQLPHGKKEVSQLPWWMVVYHLIIQPFFW